MTSILFSLSFRLSACIHALMAWIHCSMGCNASASLRSCLDWKKDKAGYRQRMHVRWAGTTWWPRTACWHRHLRVGARDTNPEGHQMAMENYPISLHSPTRTGYDHDENHVRAASVMPNEVSSRRNSMAWSTVSNAVLRSSNTRIDTCRLFMLDKISFTTLSSAVSVLCPFL